jgi:hypothetical protein
MVVLANSWKHADWCLAGIDLDSGFWVRPVSDLNDGRIPRAAMRLDGYFPKLLDVIELPLAPTGPGYGFEKENRRLLPGPWKRYSALSPEMLIPYAENPDGLLHNHEASVSVEVLRQKPIEERCSLQLVHTETFRVRRACKRSTGEPTWQGIMAIGDREPAIRITDPVLVGKLSAGYVPSPACLVTLSLSMPYKPADWPEDQPPACWKLIAGIIELPAQRTPPGE